MPSTLRIMKEEFGRADKIMQHIFAGTKPWDALFERHSFFTKDHKYYLSVVAASRSKEGSATFSGLVQSKVRHIVKGIDDGQTGIDTARPYIEYFERVHRCKDDDQAFEVSQGNLDYMIPSSELPKEGNVPANGDARIIYTTTFYIGLTLPPGKFGDHVTSDKITNDRADGTKHERSKHPVGNTGGRSADDELLEEEEREVGKRDAGAREEALHEEATGEL